MGQVGEKTVTEGNRIQVKWKCKDVTKIQREVCISVE